MESRMNRRNVLVTTMGAMGALVFMPATLRAQGLGLSSILGRASDNALDQLARPGAFYDDEDIRIGLPVIGNIAGRRSGLLGSLMGAVDRTGLLDGITRNLNDAAGVAAGEAKPIFRDAIDGLSLSDAPGIARESDGGTQYLRRSSSNRLHSRLEPLVDGALEQTGVYGQFDRLAEQHSFIREAGLSRERINRSVTDQGLDGIFAYIGAQEREFRRNPLSGLGNLLGN